MSGRRLAATGAACAVLILLLAPAAGRAAAPAAAAPSIPGLAEGNRLFRSGRPAEAMAAWSAGWRASREPVLAYNLGTAAQQLGRLPEAVLWYRRAQAALPGDPWVRDNLELARRALGPVAAPAPGPLALLAARRGLLRWGGVGLAWAALPLALLRGRAARRGLGAAVLLAAVAYGAGAYLGRAGPHPAVLLEDCGEELAAGAEVWVAAADDGSRMPAANGGYRVLGAPAELRCPAVTVARVAP